MIDGRHIENRFWPQLSSQLSDFSKILRWDSPPSPLLAVPNVTAHPSTASVSITVLLYDGPLLCDLIWRLKGLISKKNRRTSSCLVFEVCIFYLGSDSDIAIGVES